MASPVFPKHSSFLARHATTIVISLVMGLIASSTIAVLAFYLTRDITSLALILKSNSNLVSTSGIERDRLSIFWDGRPVDELWVASIQLINDGNQAFGPEDSNTIVEAVQVAIGLELTRGEILEARIEDASSAVHDR